MFPRTMNATALVLPRYTYIADDRPAGINFQLDQVNHQLKATQTTQSTSIFDRRDTEV